MNSRTFLRLAPLAAAALAIALGASGCFNPFAPQMAATRGISTPPPVPNTPQNVLRLFEWCWNNRAINEYSEIFTADYVFQFAATDSNGNRYRDAPWTREDEIISATHLFVGGSPTEPPARDCHLDLGTNLIVQDNNAKGVDPRWHKMIAPTVTLMIDTDQQSFRINGVARFFVVRGDSAEIPQELKDAGFAPDSNRWYIERWEDETLPAGGAAVRRAPSAGAVPAGTTPSYADVSWGAIKVAYR